jgi:hypothetical protein
MVREKIAQKYYSACPDNHLAVEISGINLRHRLSASATRRENTVLRYGDNGIDLGFPIRYHLRDCRYFSTEPESRSQVNTDTGVYIPADRPDGSANATRKAVLSQLEVADHSTGRSNQVEHKIFHSLPHRTSNSIVFLITPPIFIDLQGKMTIC